MGGSERRADNAVEEGLALFQQGKLEQAMALWREAQSLAPDHTRAQEYISYVQSNREALEHRFRLAETHLFGGAQVEPSAPLEDVPSKLRLPELDSGDEEEEDEEPTVSMPVKELASRLAQSRARDHDADFMDGDHLEVMEGGGEEMVDDFEPMEKTPVGIGIPDPVRLVATNGEEDEGGDGFFEWDDDTPSVREVGQGPLESPGEPAGWTTGSELSLQDDDEEEIEELDEGDIVEELEDEPGKEKVKVRYRSLAEFDAAYDEEYVNESDLEAASEAGDATEPEEVMLELEPEQEPDPHLKKTLKLPVEPESTPILELEAEPEEGGFLELTPPDSSEERELELDLEQSIPGPSELVELSQESNLEQLEQPGKDDDLRDPPQQQEQELAQPRRDRDLLELTPEPDHEEFAEPAPEMEVDVQVNYSGQASAPPPEDETDFSSIDINMEDSVDMAPDEVEFGGAMEFDDVGEVEDESQAAAPSGETGAVSSGGLSWEEGSIDWDKERAEESGLEVLVFERDDPTPAVGDPILALATQQDSLDLHLEESGEVHRAPPAAPEEDPLAWAPTEETPDAPDMFPDVGFTEEQQQTPRGPTPQFDAGQAVEPTLQMARDLLKQGELEDALQVCQQVCEAEAGGADAPRFLERIQQSLLKRYWADIGDLSHVPAVKVPSHEILWQDMDHRQGFLLSRIDGMLTYEDIIDISGMDDFEVCRALVILKKDGVIA